MFQLCVQQFIRSAGPKIGLAFLLVAGLVSLLIGRQFLDRQQKNVADTIAAQREEIRRNVAYHASDIGLLLYYVPFGLVNETHPINGLSIGQRDVNPSVQRVTIRGLEAQRYDADLTNPGNLLLGNLDFSFVLLYLFPLLIIGFTYNLLSGERENGTWRLALVQSRNPMGFVGQLFLVRILFVISVLILVLGLAVPWLGLPLDAAFWGFLGTSVLYVLFWFAISFWVTSRQWASSTNAVWLVTIWLLLLVILPAAINQHLINRYPVPEAFDTAVKQRRGYHEKWDLPKQGTLDKFYAHYPQFKTYALPDKEFSWLWYYAMQQLGDDESANESAAMRKKLQQRDKISRSIAYFVPTIHTQIALNELARSGLSNQLRFLEATTVFHEQKRLYFYPKVFAETPVNSVNWDSFNVEFYTDETAISMPGIGLPLLLISLLFVVFGWVKLKRNFYWV